MQEYHFESGFSKHCLEWDATNQEYQVWSEHLYPEERDWCHNTLRSYKSKTDAELDYELRCALVKGDSNQLALFL